jgi:hypothetical protein
MKAPVYILEGSWWSKRETPLTLSYLQALAASHGDIDLSHRTIRSADDIAFYVKRLGRNERVVEENRDVEIGRRARQAPHGEGLGAEDVPTHAERAHRALKCRQDPSDRGGGSRHRCASSMR